MAMRITREIKKRNKNQLACDCCHAFSLWLSALIPALTNHRKGFRESDDSTINLIVFTTQNDELVYTTTLWTDRCLTTLGITMQLFTDHILLLQSLSFIFKHHNQ
jgi:hypothetical protein